MIYKRKILKQLKEWKNSNRRNPLVIRDARQVGKSTLVREFSHDYDVFVELNLERKEDCNLFDLDNVKYIYEAIPLAD